MGRVHSLNVSEPKLLGMRKDGPVYSAIHKLPVDGRAPVAGINIAGDGQADRTVHGGPDMAIYAYALEDVAWWGEELGRDDITAGMFGENLTTEGIDVSGAVIGERWRFGSLLLEVCQPRQPCFKLAMLFDDPKMVKRFAQASRPGAYLRIIEEGDVGAGDTIEVEGRPGHGVTLAVVSAAVLRDHSLAEQALAAAAHLAPPVVDQLRQRLPRA